MTRLSVLYPTGAQAKVRARRAAAAATVHPAETSALRALKRVGDFALEHLGPALWCVDGVELDRWLLCELSVAVMRRTELPA